METLFTAELVLSLGSIACLAWKIAGLSEPEAPAAAMVAAGQGGSPGQPAEAPAAPGGSQETQAPDLTRLRWALASAQVPVRLAAAAELSVIPDQEALELVCGLVRDPDYEIRRIAVQRIGAERSPAHTDLLLQAARDVRIEVQNAACEGLIGNRDPRVIELFRRMAMQGLHYAKLLGLRGLGACGGEEGLLLEIYRNTSGRVQDEAAVALAGSRTPEALGVVRDYLKQKLSQGASGAATVAVDEAQFRQVLDQEPSVPMIEELESKCHDLPPAQRKGEVLACLSTLASDETADERRRYLAVRGLGFLGGQPVLEKLQDYRSHPVIAVRFGATIALGKLRSARALDLLKQALGDPSSLVRAAAVVFLGQMGNSVERGIFEAAAQDPDRLVNGLANQVLQSRQASRPAILTPARSQAVSVGFGGGSGAFRPATSAGVVMATLRGRPATRGVEAVEALMRPLRNRPMTRAPRARFTIGDGRKLTLSEVLRGA
jgi:HEAT repeat protein